MRMVPYSPLSTLSSCTLKFSSSHSTCFCCVVPLVLAAAVAEDAGLLLLLLVLSAEPRRERPFEDDMADERSVSLSLSLSLSLSFLLLLFRFLIEKKRERRRKREREEEREREKRREERKWWAPAGEATTDGTARDDVAAALVERFTRVPASNREGICRREEGPQRG